MKIPFLFSVPMWNQYFVYFGSPSYEQAKTDWMFDENLPEDQTFQMCLDLVRSGDIFCFSSEREALLKMRELWASVEI